MNIPTFETTRLLLRPLCLKDAASYENNFVDYEVIRHLSDSAPWPYPKGGVYTYIEDIILPKQGKDYWAWAIFQKENHNEVIGCIDLWRKGVPEHRGFWLGQKYWGKGYMTEAVDPVMDYSFGSLGFDELCFSNAVGNMRSRRIKEKTGAKLVKVIDTKHVDPLLTQSEIWILTKEEWNNYKN
jgi:RimJ/RimL family protein N-acetyltransferase